MLVVMLVLLGCSEPEGGETAAAASIVFHTGKVYTVNDNQPWATAIAIKQEKIIYVGDDEGALKLVGPRTRVVNLAGKMLLPGFQDAHVHPIEAGMAYLGCSLHGATSITEYLEVLESCDRSFPESAFVDGGGWTMDLFPNGLPDKKLIDSIIPSRPVILKSATGHQLWVNSAALEMAGIDSESTDPPRGRIDRYPSSSVPSGSLQENSAMNLVLDARPPYSEEQMVAALQFGQFYLNQYGVTSVQDALLKLDGNEAYVGGPTYMTLEESGNLTLKVSGAIVWNTDLGMEQISRIIEARERFNTRRLKARSVKIWLDGVLEVHTAALLEPYSDKEDGTTGELLIPPKMLREVITKLDALDFQIHFHAIGDAAIRASLDAIEVARSINGEKDNRHHISHIQLFNPADIPRFAELGVAANFQPYWAWADKFITELTIPKLGEERSQWLYPIKSLLDSGALVVFGSDWFVSSGNPLLGIETAITRRDPLTNESAPFLDHQRVGLSAALQAYTLNSAYINFIEHETGSIEVGKQADLTVLDRNLFDLKSSEISEASVLLTLIDGERVYGEWSLAPLGKTAL
ncbi:amidohydrolase [Luminiphilus sp.]|nr:amidohydrolase [Luminiphilus sp.]